jgi:hypothetical protein
MSGDPSESLYSELLSPASPSPGLSYDRSTGRRYLRQQSSHPLLTLLVSWLWKILPNVTVLAAFGALGLRFLLVHLL